MNAVERQKEWDALQDELSAMWRNFEQRPGNGRATQEEIDALLARQDAIYAKMRGIETQYHQLKEAIQK